MNYSPGQKIKCDKNLGEIQEENHLSLFLLFGYNPTIFTFLLG